MTADTDRLLTRVAIDALIAEFAWRIDHGESASVAELFTEDGWYGREDGSRSVGRDAIRNAYAARAARGERTARHIFTNLRLTVDGPDRAHGTCILLLFAADGAPPHPAVPQLVQDYEDVYHRIDGQWLFAQRGVRRLFVAEDFAPVLPLGTGQTGKTEEPR
ncbi:MAG: nuclear transport factor 2 family protein [Bauldia litoralis]